MPGMTMQADEETSSIIEGDELMSRQQPHSERLFSRWPWLFAAGASARDGSLQSAGTLGTDSEQRAPSPCFLDPTCVPDAICIVMQKQVLSVRC